MSELEDDLKAAAEHLASAIKTDKEGGDEATILIEIKKARRRLKLAQESLEG